MISLTIRHRREDGLRASLDLLQRSYRRLTGHRAWRALLARYGYVGQCRAIEMPWGRANGWHPHAHVLAFLGKELDDQEVKALEREAFELWQAAVLAEGGRSLLAERGLRVTRGAAGYVAKVQEGEGWTAGAELARVDLKRGRGGSLLPFELLDQTAEWARALWVEYVTVTKGRRAIFWSKGLRALVGLDQEQSDEEVIDQVEQADLVYLIDGPDYDRMRDHPSVLVDRLEEAEAMVADAGKEEDMEAHRIATWEHRTDGVLDGLRLACCCGWETELADFDPSPGVPSQVVEALVKDLVVEVVRQHFDSVGLDLVRVAEPR